MAMIIVRLLKPYGQNNTGEICGFPAHVADDLITKQIAVSVREQEAPARVDKMEHGGQSRPRRSTKAESNGN